MKKENIGVIMQAFYGNRTYTDLREDTVDYMLQGVLDKKLGLDHEVDRTIIAIPDSKCVLVYRDDNITGEGAYHAVNCAVPSLRGCADLTCNFTDLLIYAVEHTGEITDDTAN